MHFQVKGIILTGLYMDNNAKQKDMIECLSLKPGKGSKKKVSKSSKKQNCHPTYIKDLSIHNEVTKRLKLCSVASLGILCGSL